MSRPASITPGMRLTLPSGQRVQVLYRAHEDSDHVLCGYLDSHGNLRPDVAQGRNRVTLLEHWLAQHARAA